MGSGDGEGSKSSENEEFWKDINQTLYGDDEDDDQSLETIDPFAKENPLADSCSALAQASATMGMPDFADAISKVGNQLLMMKYDDDDREDAHQKIQKIMLKYQDEIRDAMTAGGKKSLPATEFQDLLMKRNDFEAALRNLDKAFGQAPRVIPRTPTTPMENSKAPSASTEVKQNLGSRITNSLKQRWSRTPTSENSTGHKNSLRERFSKLFETGTKNNERQRMSTHSATPPPEPLNERKPR